MTSEKTEVNLAGSLKGKKKVNKSFVFCSKYGSETDPYTI